MLQQKSALLPALVVLLLAGCSGQDDAATGQTAAPEESDAAPVAAADDDALADNPFLSDWDTPFGVPPFGEIEEAHFMPAFRSRHGGAQ